MPRHKNELVSKTMVRDKNETRVVITLEVTVSKEGLDSLPNYKHTAQDYVKETFDPEPIWEALVDALGEHCDTTDLKMEALS